MSVVECFLLHQFEPERSNRRITTAELLGAAGFLGNFMWIVFRFGFGSPASWASEMAPAPNASPSVSGFLSADDWSFISSGVIRFCDQSDASDPSSAPPLFRGRRAGSCRSSPAIPSAPIEWFARNKCRGLTGSSVWRQQVG
jgi:hypothetical protein